MGIKASIVILTLKVPEHLIDQLNQQTYKNFEIIVAQEKGIVRAMNNALAKAKGDIFVRIDDDVILPPTWLEELLKPFYDPFVGGATGPTLIPPDLRKNRDSIKFVDEHCGGLLLKWLFDFDVFAPAKIYKCGSVSYGSNFGEAISPSINYKIDHLEGTNWAMRTHLIKSVGGFDEAYDGVCEWFDTDVVYKAKKKGYKLRYNPQAFLYHIVAKAPTYNERFDGWSRIKNWLRFHWRHSKFHYKKIIWLMLMVGYFIKARKQGGGK